jgi:Suppressor of fused protein (SUFU)
VTLESVRGHLREHFGVQPDSASVTFLGLQPIEVLRFATGPLVQYVSLGCSREPPHVEVVLRLRDPGSVAGLARSLALVAATPAVEGVELAADALIDLGSRLWAGAPFSAVLLGLSDIPDVDAVRFLAAVPVTATEAAWVRLKGAQAMRQAWEDDGVDVLDPGRSAAQPH